MQRELKTWKLDEIDGHTWRMEEILHPYDRSDRWFIPVFNTVSTILLVVWDFTQRMGNSPSLP